jgi:3-hydroxybutyryl-CoA dehydrogenase
MGMGHPMGLQLADFIGLDVCLAILNVMYDGFKTKNASCPLLVNMVRWKIRVKSGEAFMFTAKAKGRQNFETIYIV